ncbi:MAG: hypothetical protein RAK22_00450 [Nanoarchaeota archaeon]|nr:hypothetical protein [Nanoarchaeota archaeon]
MDKPFVIVIGIVFLLIILVAVFYMDPYEQHREVAIGLCELQCNRIMHNSSATIDVSHGQYCLSKDLIFNYNCAVSSVENQSLCGSGYTVFLNNQCQLISVG